MNAELLQLIDAVAGLRVAVLGEAMLDSYVEGSVGIDRAAPWVVVHPGASAPSRRYPPESFAEAARALGRC